MIKIHFYKWILQNKNRPECYALLKYIDVCEKKPKQTAGLKALKDFLDSEEAPSCWYHLLFECYTIWKNTT